MKWSACQERGTKKKIWVPDRIRTYDLPNTGRALYPLELRRTHRERGHILGSFLTRVLHTARISNVDVALCGERMKDCKSSFFSWIIDSFLSFEKRPNIDLYVEYSRTLIWFSEDSKFAYKITKFYAKNGLCATSDKNADFNISKNMLC